MDISVVFPVYNERENIVPLLDELEATLDGLGKSYELLAVDDGSTDGSTRLLAEEAKRRRGLRAIILRRNSGQAAAFDAGFREARGAAVFAITDHLVPARRITLFGALHPIAESPSPCDVARVLFYPNVSHATREAKSPRFAVFALD